ncbi:MAG: mucoidy inhibitor MuiA family protein [Hyphomicrobiaceae bacterium]|nr:mucoidy inhibitor MuiA family protein [Hyphomicrobiaceae bacterium]
MRWLIALPVSMALAGAAAATEVKGSSRIDAVTVYPSGAEITRIAHVQLEKGEHTLLFTDLPAEAVAGSIRVEGKATARLQIGSVDTRSVSVPRGDEAVAASERRRIEDAIEKLKDDRSALKASITGAQTQKRLIDNLTKLPSTPAPAGAAPSTQPDWGQLFELVGKRTAEAQKAILDSEIKVRDVERQVKDLEGKLASLAPSQQARTEVKVALTAEAALEADMTVRYQVQNASWTPFYDARLSVGSKAEAPKLQLIRRASIRQRTGEVWDNVALALSTARPSAGTAAPVLTPVTVDLETERVATAVQPPAAAPRQARRRSLQPEPNGAAREEEGCPEGRTCVLLEPRLVKKELVKEEVASVDVEAFQAVYGIAGRTSVPDTGETKRVEIDEMALEPGLVVRTVPKREEKAYLYAKITTAKGAPVLPGQVSLFRDAIFVGTGQLPLLAPGEEHELGFGVDDSIRVRYALAEEKRSKTGIISTTKIDARSYRTSVKNLHERTIEVSVLDQVPVSQNTDITVELTGNTAPSRRDVDNKRGILAWDFKLEPAEERVIDFGYRAAWPAAKNVTYGEGS